MRRSAVQSSTHGSVSIILLQFFGQIYSKFTDISCVLLQMQVPVTCCRIVCVVVACGHATDHTLMSLTPTICLAYLLSKGRNQQTVNRSTTKFPHAERDAPFSKVSTRKQEWLACMIKLSANKIIKAHP